MSDVVSDIHPYPIMLMVQYTIKHHVILWPYPYQYHCIPFIHI